MAIISVFVLQSVWYLSHVISRRSTQHLEVSFSSRENRISTLNSHRKLCVADVTFALTSHKNETRCWALIKYTASRDLSEINSTSLDDVTSCALLSETTSLSGDVIVTCKRRRG